MSDSTPTEHFTPIETPSSAGRTAGPSRRLFITLISVAGALLLAVIILLIVLLTRGGDEPAVVPSDSPSATASSTPTQTATSPAPSPTPAVPDPEEPAPPATPQGIKSFSANATAVTCSPAVDSIPLHFKWSANGVSLWFGVNTPDAKAAPYGQYELTDELDIDYQCNGAGSQTYTITVESGDGTLTSRSITVVETS